MVFFFLRMFLCFHIFDTGLLLLLQILIARSRNKSRFLHEQKVEWDRLFEEARLRAGMAAQLAAAQEQEAKARRDAEEIHGMFADLSAKVKLEEEEAARILKERDELLEKNAQASKRAAEVLKELDTEWDLR